MKQRTTAGIFALLLGGIGGHKFYLGKTSQGIIYLLFSWTFIPGIIALIEGIKYLTMSDEEFNLKYNGTATPYPYYAPNVQQTNQPKTTAPEYSESDKEFMGKMFFEFEKQEYDNTKSYHNMIMDMICYFMDYMNTLESEYKEKFHEREKLINEMNGGNANYWDMLLKNYKNR